MVDTGDAIGIGRSILVGVALDQLRVRSRPILIVLAVVAGLGLLGTIAFDDGLRVLAVLVFVLALIVLAVALVARFLAGAVLKRIAPPAQVADHREVVQDAVDRLALPTGPIKSSA